MSHGFTICPNCGEDTLNDEGYCHNCEYSDDTPKGESFGDIYAKHLREEFADEGDFDEDDDEDFEDPWEKMDRLDREGRGDEAYGVLLDTQGADRKCIYCGRNFRGMPDHSVCNPCADKVEQGMDLEPYEEPEPTEEPMRIPAREWMFKSRRPRNEEQGGNDHGGEEKSP